MVSCVVYHFLLLIFTLYLPVPSLMWNFLYFWLQCVTRFSCEKSIKPLQIGFCLTATFWSYLTLSLSVRQSCWNCGRKASETCSGCNTARYCGSFCQHKDWEKHHHVCGQTLQAQQQQQQASQQQGGVPGSETPAPISSSACTPSSGTGSPAATPPAATPRSSTPSTPSSSALDGTPR